MKKLFVLVLSVISLAGWSQESVTRNLGSFTGIKVSQGISVYLKKGDKESAKVEVTGTDPSNVITEVSGSYLKIYMDDGGRYRNTNVKVYVTYVRIDRLSASSAANIYADSPIKANKMEISASSAASVEILLEGGAVEASASSAGEVELKGKCQSLFADASSAGKVDAFDMESSEVEAEASSGGSVKIFVQKDLRAHASSGGSIRYRGNPDKQITDSSSGGSVRKSN